MTLSAEVTSLTDIAAPWPWVAPTLLAAILALVLYRTRSTHTVLSRLWQLVHGKGQCNDPAIASFLDERGALMQFRFMTGLKPRTRLQALRIISWSKNNEEDIGDLASCGKHFDIEKVALCGSELLPKQWHLFGLYAVAFSLGIACAGALLATISSDPLLRMKSSGTFFFLSTDYARSFGGDATLTREQCRQENQAASKFLAEDAMVICEAMRDEKLAAYLKKALVEQRWILAVLATFVGYLAYLAWLGLVHGVNARAMRRRLDQRSAK